MADIPEQVLDELALPLGPDAGLVEALAVAIAVEQTCDVTLPDWAIDPVHLGRREAVRALLDSLDGR